MSKPIRFGLACAALAGLLSVSGCALLKPAPDPARGHWEGFWYLAKLEKPGGALRCDVERVGKREWVAVFEAEFGGRAVYTVKLDGRPAGEKAAFGGEVDLGAQSGGVFKWTGEADGQTFTGKYASSLYGGTFEMKRTSEIPAKKADGGSPPTPTPAK